METAFLITIILLISFALLAIFDGFYLHLVRYKLYLHPESRNEHITHTIRALLFPLILYFLYLGSSDLAFYVGISLVAIDIIVLGFDAYMEKDSRAFMGGLPRWEYIIHLMVNGFHFASIAVFLVIKLHLTPDGLVLISTFSSLPTYGIFTGLVTQLIPGGILMGIFHAALMFKKPVAVYERVCKKLNCCQMTHGGI
ncbi:hypothetical protein [Dyadobacter beijingensis]|uniref:hypothetical protein n=1 Tax=Dyadobacter beijingensis TaxID=365489 RepID=UPI00037E9233|nr:hypothetical protein [Dyadobacter beijingensis]